jgi:hypothetical protein
MYDDTWSAKRCLGYWDHRLKRIDSDMDILVTKTIYGYEWICGNLSMVNTGQFYQIN